MEVSGFPRRFGPVVGVLLLAVAACDRAPEPTPTPAPTAAPTAAPVEPTIVPTPQPPPEHRIGVRVVEGVGEFYDRETGERFVPRGNNYIRLADQQSASGETFFYHSTFNVGLYDPATAERGAGGRRV